MGWIGTESKIVNISGRYQKKIIQELQDYMKRNSKMEKGFSQ